MVNANRVKWVILDSPYIYFTFVLLGGSLVETAVVKNQSYSADFWVSFVFTVLHVISMCQSPFKLSKSLHPVGL